MTKTLAMVFSAFWLGACATTGASSTSAPTSTTMSKPAYCDGLEAQASGEQMHAYHSCIHACNTATPRPECR
jgi:hypothetical protein